MNAKKIVKFFVFIFFVITWLWMCRNSINFLTEARAEFTFGPLDVVRRITAPDGTKTALLVRSYGSLLDLNFALYISDDQMVDVNDSSAKASFITDPGLSPRENAAFWIKRALWISRDYELTTNRNWHEDLAWSADGDIVAVSIEKQYAFAYDFGTGKRYEDHGSIEELFLLHRK